MTEKHQEKHQVKELSAEGQLSTKKTGTENPRRLPEQHHVLPNSAAAIHGKPFHHSYPQPCKKQGDHTDCSAGCIVPSAEESYSWNPAFLKGLGRGIPAESN